MPLIAAYAIAQRYLPMSPWDQHWLDTTDFDSIGTGRNDHSVRVFGIAQQPGHARRAPLGWRLLCYLGRFQHRTWAIAGVRC